MQICFCNSLYEISDNKRFIESKNEFSNNGNVTSNVTLFDHLHLELYELLHNVTFPAL